MHADSQPLRIRRQLTWAFPPISIYTHIFSFDLLLSAWIQSKRFNFYLESQTKRALHTNWQTTV